MRSAGSKSKDERPRVLRPFSRAAAFFMPIAVLSTWGCGEAKKSDAPAWCDSGRLRTDPAPAIDDEGDFLVGGKRTHMLGVEEPPADEEGFKAAVPLIRNLCADFALFYVTSWPYRSPDQYEQLEKSGIWIAQQVAEAKMVENGLPLTGGGMGTFPDEEFTARQMASIEDIVGRLASSDHILFWWIGGELVEPEFHEQGGERLRELVAALVDAIHKADPLHRPITIQRHILEIGMYPDNFVDLSDIVDFMWVTIATHAHRGDFEEIMKAMTASGRRTGGRRGRLKALFAESRLRS